MLSLPEMIAHAAPDAPPGPAPRPNCQGCNRLVTRSHPAGTAGPPTTSARCLGPQHGPRLIGWHRQPTDAAPHWCPGRVAA